MTATRVVNVKREACDVPIYRGTRWGNPFRIGVDGDRAAVILQYRAYLRTRPDLLAAIPTLKGQRLGCYCAPLACHGDVLRELAEAAPEPARQEVLL